MVSRAFPAAALIAVIAMPSAGARADGGAVRMREAVGPLTLTLFAPPDPIAAGSIDVSVLVQDRTGAPVLDGLVTLRLTSSSGDTDRLLEATATHDAATNKLLYAAWIDVGAGQWDLRVLVEHGGETARMNVPLSITPATMPLTDYWPHSLLPPIAIVVFAVHQCLVEARRSSHE
jgi:hypothetical protein